MRGINAQATAVGILVLAVVATSLLRLATYSRTDDPDGGRVAGASIQRLDNQALEQLPFVRPPTRTSDQDPAISVKAAYLVDIASGYPLYADSERTPVPIASTTKLMTAVIVSETYDLNDTVTVSAEAAGSIGSDIQLMTGEQLSVDALLKGLLIQSGNDAALALAEHIGATTFIAKMNAKAAELGMTDTLFKDPAGLDDTGHSSARDLGILGAYAMRNEVIRGIVRITEATIESTDLRFSHKLETSNRLLKADHPLFLSEATGLKTGYTPDAGHCLVASAEQNGHQLVSVVLHTAENTAEASAKESRKLLTWGFANHEWEQE